MKLLSDEPILEKLRSPDADVRDDGIGELRAALLRGLSVSLTNRYGKPFSPEDVVQEALLKILDSLDSFRGQCKFMTWAMTVATRIGISSLRRKYHQDVSLEKLTGDDGYRIDVAAPPGPSADDTEERDRMLAMLQQLIDHHLTAKQQQALRAFLAGFSTDNIADRLGTNRNAVYKLIHDARVKLRTGFEEAGVSADDLQTIFA